MVVPYKQVQDFSGLLDEELADLLKLSRSCQNALSRVMNAHGFNMGINIGKVAGAGIHEHLHIQCCAALGGRHQLHARAGGIPTSFLKPWQNWLRDSGRRYQMNHPATEC
jgi:hypothetical protein